MAVPKTESSLWEEKQMNRELRQLMEDEKEERKEMKFLDFCLMQILFGLTDKKFSYALQIDSKTWISCFLKIQIMRHHKCTRNCLPAEDRDQLTVNHFVITGITESSYASSLKSYHLAHHTKRDVILQLTRKMTTNKTKQHKIYHELIVEEYHFQALL